MWWGIIFILFNFCQPLNFLHVNEEIEPEPDLYSLPVRTDFNRKLEYYKWMHSSIANYLNSTQDLMYVQDPALYRSTVSDNYLITAVITVGLYSEFVSTEIGDRLSNVATTEQFLDYNKLNDIEEENTIDNLSYVDDEDSNPNSTAINVYKDIQETANYLATSVGIANTKDSTPSWLEEDYQQTVSDLATNVEIDNTKHNIYLRLVEDYRQTGTDLATSVGIDNTKDSTPSELEEDYQPTVSDLDTNVERDNTEQNIILRLVDDYGQPGTDSAIIVEIDNTKDSTPSELEEDYKQTVSDLSTNVEIDNTKHNKNVLNNINTIFLRLVEDYRRKVTDSATSVEIGSTTVNTPSGLEEDYQQTGSDLDTSLETDINTDNSPSELIYTDETAKISTIVSTAANSTQSTSSSVFEDLIEGSDYTENLKTVSSKVSSRISTTNDVLINYVIDLPRQTIDVITFKHRYFINTIPDNEVIVVKKTTITNEDNISTTTKPSKRSNEESCDYFYNYNDNVSIDNKTLKNPAFNWDTGKFEADPVIESETYDTASHLNHFKYKDVPMQRYTKKQTTHPKSISNWEYTSSTFISDMIPIRYKPISALAHIHSKSGSDLVQNHTKFRSNLVSELAIHSKSISDMIPTYAKYKSDLVPKHSTSINVVPTLTKSVSELVFTHSKPNVPSTKQHLNINNQTFKVKNANSVDKYVEYKDANNARDYKIYLLPTSSKFASVILRTHSSYTSEKYVLPTRFKSISDLVTTNSISQSVLVPTRSKSANNLVSTHYIHNLNKVVDVRPLNVTIKENYVNLNKSVFMEEDANAIGNILVTTHSIPQSDLVPTQTASKSDLVPTRFKSISDLVTTYSISQSDLVPTRSKSANNLVYTHYIPNLSKVVDVRPLNVTSTEQYDNLNNSAYIEDDENSIDNITYVEYKDADQSRDYSIIRTKPKNDLVTTYSIPQSDLVTRSKSASDLTDIDQYFNLKNRVYIDGNANAIENITYFEYKDSDIDYGKFLFPTRSKSLSGLVPIHAKSDSDSATVTKSKFTLSKGYFVPNRSNPTHNSKHKNILSTTTKSLHRNSRSSIKQRPLPSKSRKILLSTYSKSRTKPSKSTKVSVTTLIIPRPTISKPKNTRKNANTKQSGSNNVADHTVTKPQPIRDILVPTRKSFNPTNSKLHPTQVRDNAWMDKMYSEYLETIMTTTTIDIFTEEVNTESTIIIPEPLDMRSIRRQLSVANAKDLVKKNKKEKVIDPVKLINYLEASVEKNDTDGLMVLEEFKRRLSEFNISTCVPIPTTSDFTISTTEPPSTIDFSNTSIVAKCYVCGLDVEGIPYTTSCADAFGGDFLPLAPVNAKSKGLVDSYKKYCHHLDVNRVIETPDEPRSVFGRFTGGCSVRWVDLSGVYTQRSCRNRRRAVLGKHFASKRMAKLEMALQDVDDGCIISPMASLLPLARSMSLYARFHACVCSGYWCNSAVSTHHWMRNLLILVFVSLS